MHFTSLLLCAAVVRAGLFDSPLITAIVGPGPDSSALLNVGALVGVLGPAQCGLQNGVLTVEVLVDLPPLLAVCLCVDVLATLSPGQTRCPPCNHGKGVCVTTATGAGCGCTCDLPYKLNHDGICVLPPSQSARKARSLNGVGSSFWSSIEMCPSSETACRLPSGGFECIDTTNALDSCGGCVGPSVVSGGGMNCESIPGALSMTCRDSKCEVYSCYPGWSYRAGKCHRDSRV